MLLINKLFIVLLLFSASIESAPLKVLTYNICWECMTNSSSGSAGNLGALCTLEEKIDQTGQKIMPTKCAANMAQAIDDITSTDFDFVALQEASRWQILQKLSKTLSGNTMTALSFKWGENDFVTFYNKKYSLKHEIKGGFVDGAKKSRPFHILIFNEPLIFVNLHNGHGDAFNMMNMERKLSAALKEKLSPAAIKNLSNYRMVLAGDFNDHSDHFWPDLNTYNLTFIPFRYAGLSTAVHFPLQILPEITCCSQITPFKSSTQLSKVSDFVLDSETNIAPTSTHGIPEIYFSKGYALKPLSDHLPVVYDAN